MAREQSIFSRIKDKMNEKSLSELERKEQERNAKKLIRLKKMEHDDKISDMIYEIQLELNRLSKEFSDHYWLEIDKARIEKSDNIRNARRYAKIATMFYSYQVVNEAKVRVAEQKEDFEIRTLMDSMETVLTAMKELNGDIGTWSIKKIKKEAKTLASSSTGATKALEKTVKVLDKLSIKNEDKTAAESLVNFETIDRWVEDNAFAQKCWKTGEGGTTSVDDMLVEKASSSETYYEEKAQKTDTRAVELRKRMQALDE